MSLNMTAMKPILVHVASGKWEALQTDAQRLGVSASQLVRDAIEHHFVSGRVVMACQVKDSMGALIGSGIATLVIQQGIR